MTDAAYSYIARLAEVARRGRGKGVGKGRRTGCVESTFSLLCAHR